MSTSPSDIESKLGITEPSSLETPAPDNVRELMDNTKGQITGSIDKFSKKQLEIIETQIQEELVQTKDEFDRLVGKFNPETKEFEGVENSELWQEISAICPHLQLDAILKEASLPEAA